MRIAHVFPIALSNEPLHFFNIAGKGCTFDC